MKLDEIIARINKKFGEGIIGLASEIKYADVPRLPSGSLFLDLALGQNKKEKVFGWPLGRIVELFGPESSGKTLISLKTIAEAQKAGFDCVFFDCENTYSESFAVSLGVDVKKLILSRESQGEKLLDLACEILKNSDKVKIMVFDSLASMIPLVEVDDPLDQSQMAPMARLMSKGLRKLTASNKHGALIIFINQLRENPGAGPYANPEYTPGGKALKFYASLRVDVRRGEWIFGDNEKKKKIGQVVKFKVVKNKTDVPLKEGYFRFLYKGEIDRIDELISIGLLNNKIDRKGAYYYFMDRTFQGRDEIEKILGSDSKLFDKAKEEIFSE
jgi:recombination protein RecA